MDNNTACNDTNDRASTIDLGWVRYGSEADRSKAMGIARGCYQSALLRGFEAWSGSTLRGKARKWGAGYARSRKSLAARLRAAGLSVYYVSAGRRKILVVGAVAL